LGVAWAGAAEFAVWYRSVMSILHQQHPGILVGFPGLSPNQNVSEWLSVCAEAILASDWLAVHCYWRGAYLALIDAEEHGGYWHRFRQLFPQKRTLITEFSNNDLAVSKDIKGQQYVAYIKQLPSDIEFAYCFISSSDTPSFVGETWADEWGNLSQIPYIVGGSVTPPPPPSTAYNKPQSMGGVHISSGERGGYHDWLVNCGRSVFIKSFMDFGALMEAKTVNRDTVTVIRVLPQGIDEDTPSGNWQWPLADSQRIARHWMSKCYPLLDLNGREWFDYVEVMNEPDPADAAAMERASLFVIECMKDADLHGYKLAIWAWAAGLPRTPRLWPGEFDQMERTLETLKYAAEHGHALAVHEGSVSDERRLIQQAAEDRTALRYRVTAQMMAEKGWPMPPVVITEAYQENGYRRPDWDDWKWYWTELAKDPHVLGAGWFTLGDWEFGGGQNVNIVGQLEGMAQAIASLPIIGG